MRFRRRRAAWRSGLTRSTWFAAGQLNLRPLPQPTSRPSSLHSLSQSQYKGAFEAEGVAVSELREISTAKLRELVPLEGHRRRIVRCRRVACLRPWPCGRAAPRALTTGWSRRAGPGVASARADGRVPVRRRLGQALEEVQLDVVRLHRLDDHEALRRRDHLLRGGGAVRPDRGGGGGGGGGGRRPRRQHARPHGAGLETRRLRGQGAPAARHRRRATAACPPRHHGRR